MDKRIRVGDVTETRSKISKKPTKMMSYQSISVTAGHRGSQNSFCIGLGLASTNEKQWCINIQYVHQKGFAYLCDRACLMVDPIRKERYFYLTAHSTHVVKDRSNSEI